MIKGSLVSVNVAKAKRVLWNDRDVTTGIFKEPVACRVRLGMLGVDGDEQADRMVHGGVRKAVYAYPSEHYAYWQTELGRERLPWGMFGENLTTQGLLESTLHIGDEFRMGSATVAVTQPRFPCYKLGIKFGTMDMVKRFQASGRSGFYLSVLQEGDVGIGDSIDSIQSKTSNPTVQEVFESELELG